MFVDDFSDPDPDTDDETLMPSDDENPPVARNNIPSEYKIMLGDDEDSNPPAGWPRSPGARRDSVLPELIDSPSETDIPDLPQLVRFRAPRQPELRDILSDRGSLSMSDLHISGPQLRPPIPPRLLRNDSDEDEQ